MEAAEIYSLGVHELVISIFSVDWSQDNQISVITERGAHIFELQPNPLCVQPVAKFKRSFIFPSNVLPTEPFLPVINTVINYFHHHDLYSFMMDCALTPRLPEKENYVPKITSLAWSPKKIVEPSKCLLATVTSAGAIDLSFKIGYNWYSVCNLSSLWWEAIKNKLEFSPETIQADSVDVETFRKNLRRLVGTAVTWSELHESSSSVFCYLVTAYRSSDLVIWKITRLAELSMKVDPTIEYCTAFDNDVKISKLLWITLSANQYLIIIGFLDGKIYGLKISLENNTLTQKCIRKYEPDADNIPVSYLKEFSRNKNEINIIVIKNFYFIVMTINDEGEFVKQQHIQLATFSISGLALIDEGKAIVSTRDSQMFNISLKNKSYLTSERINHDMKTSKVQFLGIAGAPNCALFINVTSPDYLYDHLINREPSVIQLFHIIGEEWDPWYMLNKDDNSLSTHWNCLEIIRIKASRETEPEKFLPIIKNNKIESMSINKLRCIMWLTLITEVLKKKKIFKKIDKIVGEISEAQPLIFVHSAATHIIKLSERTELNKDMRLSIYFLRLYLEVFLAGEDENSEETFITKLAKYALDLTTKMNLIETEFCNLCGEIVTELPWNTTNCPKGHKLPRCSLTLLQITCLKYRNCVVCGRIFHPSLDEIYPEIKCLYCDVPTIYDNRITSVYDEIEEKCQNLSLRPPEDLQNNKNSENEVNLPTSKDRRFKKRRVESGEQSFTLVVNKDDETITETWEEL